MQPAHAWVVLLLQCCSGFLQFVVPWEEVPSSWLSVRVLGNYPFRVPQSAPVMHCRSFSLDLPSG